MSDLPSMPLFIDDYEAATAHLTLEEDGAYMRLLRLCWRQPKCSLPDDPAWIMRRMRVDQETYDRVVAPVLDKFFSRSRGRIFQKRLRSEFCRVNDAIERRKTAGKKGGHAKALKNNNSQAGNANDLPVANSKQSPGNIHTHTQRKKETSNDVSKEKPPPKDQKRNPNRTAIPDGWSPTPAMIAEARIKHPDLDVKHETDRFIDDAHANGRRYVDWNRAWWKWLSSPYAGNRQQQGRGDPDAREREGALRVFSA